MSITADRAEGFVHLTVDGSARLGVKISGHKRSMAGQLQSLRKGHGWIVTGERIESWEIEGLIEHGGAIYAYGPFHESAPITEIFTMQTDDAIERLTRIVSSIRTLIERSNDPQRYEPDLILSLNDGGLLLLPGDIIDGVLSAQTESERVGAFDTFNHPDLEGERNACFLVGVLAYRVLTGKLPYSAETTEEVHQRIREHRVLPPHLALPGTRIELSDLTVRSLDAEQSASLDEWQRVLERSLSEGVRSEIPAEERIRLEEEGQRFSKSAESGYQRRDFFRKNWRTMAIVAGIVVIVGAVGGTILKNALKPRITQGMSPKQVVSLFYTSMDSFNSQAMQDCVIDGAGKAAINEATNLFVISRVREGYEGTTGYVPAQKWLDEGKPQLPSGTSVYGVADLKIVQSSTGEFTVSYQKWEPVQSSGNQPQEGSGPVLMKVQGWTMQDKVYLKDEGKFWAIYRIDHTERQSIGPPLTVTNPNIPASPGARALPPKAPATQSR